MSIISRIFEIEVTNISTLWNYRQISLCFVTHNDVWEFNVGLTQTFFPGNMFLCNVLALSCSNIQIINFPNRSIPILRITSDSDPGFGEIGLGTNNVQFWRMTVWKHYRKKWYYEYFDWTLYFKNSLISASPPPLGAFLKHESNWRHHRIQWSWNLMIRYLYHISDYFGHQPLPLISQLSTYGQSNIKN